MKCLCFVCGKEFNRKPALIERAKHPVCSRKCADVLKHREWVEIPCAVCGKLILRRKSRLKTRKYNVCSEECRRKLTHILCWDETMSEEDRANSADRNYMPQNREFIKAVLKRDNYTCTICGQRGGDLQVHHLNGFAWDKENRYNIDNGTTLCKSCHRTFHSIYGQKHATKEQFYEYANQSGSLRAKS